MIALIQRVSAARMDVGGKTVGAIGQGVLALVGADMKVSLVNDGPVTFWSRAPPRA